MTDANQNPSKDPDVESAHSVWVHLVKALKKVANSLTDIVGIVAIAYVAVSGVSGSSLQITAAVIATIALGKRYYQSKRAGGGS